MASRETIRRWFREGKRRRASHMIIISDPGHEDTPVYVRDNVHGECWRYGKRIVEVYAMHLNIEKQLREPRALNLDSAPLVPILVTLEMLNEAVPAYSRGERWNGWECPFFTKAQAERLARAWNTAAVPGVTTWSRYDVTADEWLFYDSESGEDVPMRARGMNETIDGVPDTRVYHVGGFTWCWIKTTEGRNRKKA